MSMKNTTTKICSYCGSPAHTARSCAIKRAGWYSPVLAAKEAAKAEKARIKAEKEAAIVAKRASREAAKVEKARLKAENRSWRSRTARCTFCDVAGHTRVSCSILKQYKTDIPVFVRTWRAHVWNKIKDLPVGIGTMVDFHGWGYRLEDGVIVHGYVHNSNGDKQIVTGINLQTDPINPFSFKTQPIACLGTTDRWGGKTENVFGGFFPDGMFDSDYISNVRRYADHFDTNALSYAVWLPRFHASASGVTIGDSVDAGALERWLSYSESEFVEWVNYGKESRRSRRRPADINAEFNYLRKSYINYSV